MEDGAGVIDAFLRAWQNDDFERAYALLSQRDKKCMPYEEFVHVMDRKEEDSFGPIRSWTIGVPHAYTQRICWEHGALRQEFELTEIEVEFVCEDGEVVTQTYDTIKEAGEWRLSQIFWVPIAGGWTISHREGDIEEIRGNGSLTEI